MFPSGAVGESDANRDAGLHMQSADHALETATEPAASLNSNCGKKPKRYFYFLFVFENAGRYVAMWFIASKIGWC